MDHDYALAFALANKSLTLFVGAGFSKHLTGGTIPDWKQLLELACEDLSEPLRAKGQLAQTAASFPLEDCAQILELAFRREGKDLRQILATRIAAYTPHPQQSECVRQFFSRNPHVCVLTTNYDKLVERLAVGVRINSNYPGRPISRRDGGLDVYHVHGSIDNPSAMVVTTSDYYDFINSPGYFAQKIATTMHECTTVIIGYSLSDPNLKAILNAYRSKTLRTINRANVFYVTRDVLPSSVRDHYETVYGIVTVENIGVDEFLRGVESRLVEASQQLLTAEHHLTEVLAGRGQWSESYVQLKDSLFHILATANTCAIDVHTPVFRLMLESLLDRKVAFTSAPGAWEQYSHLAEWLVLLGSVLDIQGTPLEPAYLRAVSHSMNTMSKDYVLGLSWNAFQVWKNKWSNLTFKNRVMLQQFASARLSTKVDVFAVIQQ